jgi:hypothetical protein
MSSSIIELSTEGAPLIEFQDFQPLHCSKDALTDFFGWILQIILAAIAFSCLIGELRVAKRKQFKHEKEFDRFSTLLMGLCITFRYYVNLSSLIYFFFCLAAKRYCEPKYRRRPWNIWWMDTSKQGIGAIVIHMTNVYLSPLFHGDPCTW